LNEAEADAALHDLRVVDMATFLAAPFVATLLADFGADVIKVEMPGEGDHMRRHGPGKDGIGYWWLQDNRNKKGITVDLHKTKGQEIIKKLVAVSDVVIENFRPGTLEKWGLGYEEMSQINPRIILLRTTGYGQTGPYKHRRGMAALGEATGGLRELVGHPDGPPLYPGLAWGDYAASFFGIVGILVALLSREKTGLGQVIDTSICESIFRLMEYHPLRYSVEGFVARRMGEVGQRSQAEGGAPVSKDGKYIYMAFATDRIFARLAQAMGQPELANDPRFATLAARGQNRSALWEIIRVWASEHTRQEIETACDNHGVPVGAVYDMADIFADPYFTIRENLVEWDHPVLGKVKTQGAAPKLSRTPGKVKRWGPGLGEHNQQILGELLGYSPEQVEELKAEGII
jgi:crotonobetainyl-CoA:carnitine CoA-transferase CaiB-like acyl-CoA transferase